MPQVQERRNGGELVIESLQALGVSVVFGVPGIHALALWEGIRRHQLRAIVTRTELAATFAADGYARSTGRTGVVLLSTGPGALNSLTGMMEAARAHVPLLAIVSQVPRAVIGRGRGYLHDLAGQLDCFRPLTKAAFRAETVEAIPGILHQAWQAARTVPWGPVVMEIPVDALTMQTHVPALDKTAAVDPDLPEASPQVFSEAVRTLAQAQRPVIWAGGGVLRAGASLELQQLAERLQAPVALTYMGKGALPADHPLCVGSACDDGAFKEIIEDADVLLCLGTELGAETTGQWTLQPRGRLVQVDAAAERIGTTYPALPIVADVRMFLQNLLALSDRELPVRRESNAAQQVAQVQRRIRQGLEEQGRTVELHVMDAIAQALAQSDVGAFDMTIAAYWAAAYLPVARPNQFLYPLGSGTLGYAFPAALGAATAPSHQRTLAVCGDGGLHYALGELATAVQFRLPVTLLIIDDSAYGILREYQLQAFGTTHATTLHQPSFTKLAVAFGLPVRTTTADRLAADLLDSMRSEGPNVVVLPVTLSSAQATS